MNCEDDVNVLGRMDLYLAREHVAGGDFILLIQMVLL
jgi:hypothetical protein